MLRWAGNRITTQTGIGTCIAIAGVAMYSYIKAKIEEEKRVSFNSWSSLGLLNKPEYGWKHACTHHCWLMVLSFWFLVYIQKKKAWWDEVTTVNMVGCWVVLPQETTSSTIMTPFSALFCFHFESFGQLFDPNLVLNSRHCRWYEVDFSSYHQNFMIV